MQGIDAIAQTIRIVLTCYNGVVEQQVGGARAGNICGRVAGAANVQNHLGVATCGIDGHSFTEGGCDLHHITCIQNVAHYAAGASDVHAGEGGHACVYGHTGTGTHLAWVASQVSVDSCGRGHDAGYCAASCGRESGSADIVGAT